MALVNMSSFTGDAEILGAIRHVSFAGDSLEIRCGSIDDAHKILKALSIGTVKAAEMPTVEDKSHAQLRQVGQTIDEVIPATKPANGHPYVAEVKQPQTLMEAAAGFVADVTKMQQAQDAELPPDNKSAALAESAPATAQAVADVTGSDFGGVAPSPAKTVAPAAVADFDDEPVRKAPPPKKFSAPPKTESGDVAPAPAPSGDAPSVPTPVMEAPDLKAILAYLRKNVTKDVEKQIALCESWKPHVPVLRIVENLRGRVERGNAILDRAPAASPEKTE